MNKLKFKKREKTKRKNPQNKKIMKKKLRNNNFQHQL